MLILLYSMKLYVHLQFTIIDKTDGAELLHGFAISIIKESSTPYV